MWILIGYFKSYLFGRQFRRQFSTVFSCNFADTISSHYGDCPVNLAKFDCVLRKLLLQNTEPTLLQRRRSVFRWYLRQFSAVLHVILRRLPSEFGEVWSSIPKVINVVHWNNTVSTSPERWKCGPSLKQHWVSAPPPPIVHVWLSSSNWRGRSPGVRE